MRKDNAPSLKVQHVGLSLRKAQDCHAQFESVTFLHVSFHLLLD